MVGSVSQKSAWSLTEVFFVLNLDTAVEFCLQKDS